ncbi:hypothetical protein VA249_18410 [Vibrio alfacsensis]|uniref:hypothetical protein n=2 Tax=Vibrionaceae TaxID=641 RepID=UPI001BEFD356|nr:hypothetical protein [Vibrio alfacsensis]BBM65195.1 hypothetical protein VA249_18410 [Vibrio alfacsensis]
MENGVNTINQENNAMKEYLITFTLNGRRTKRRVWAYHVSDAYKRIRDEEPPKSQIGWIKSEQIK